MIPTKWSSLCCSIYPPRSGDFSTLNVVNGEKIEIEAKNYENFFGVSSFLAIFAP